MNICHSHQLEDLRRAKGLASLQIDATDFLDGDLPLYLFRYAAWALAEGGKAEVTARRTVDSMGLVLGRWSFQFVLQAAAKATAGVAELVSVDLEGRRFTFQRQTPVRASGPWSAAVMFSGRDSEVALLNQCLAGLLTQPELTDGGQILVCGPAAGAAAVQGLPGVEYLACETENVANRFIVGRKKNFAVAHLRHEKILVCHTRIALQPGCLAALPDEFDVITPAVQFVGAGGTTLPYADLLFQRFRSTSTYALDPAPYIGYPRAHWREQLRRYHPLVDGALFCTRKSLYLAHPLSDVVAWGEGEDVEWCRRLLMAGKLLELCVDAQARSLVNKANYYNRWGHLPAYGRVARFKGHVVSALNRLRR